MNRVVIITGITGFLGSHLAEYLSDNYQVVGLVRNSSDLWRLKEIRKTDIKLINLEDENVEQQLKNVKAEIFIHCAWGGVSAADRDDWALQIHNISITYNFLRLAKELKIKQFIALGSQAEYGVFSGSVHESYNGKPYSPYGAAKLATLTLVESFCSQNHIDWYWLRIFPMYGTREDVNWFVPSVIINALQNASMNLTGCEQRYGYLFVRDFCRGIEKVLQVGSSPGVYNLASNKSIKLREVVEIIINKTKSSGAFKFGALPYRENQVMHMEGNSGKFCSTFDLELNSDFETNIEEVINYYRARLDDYRFSNA